MARSRCFHTSAALCALTACLALPLQCEAESSIGVSSASARVTLRVIVPPVFKVLRVTRVPEGIEYRVWTNTRSVALSGHAYYFDKVGESTLVVPASPDPFFVHSL